MKSQMTSELTCWAMLACLVLALSACGHPYAVMTDKHSERVMLLGHDPVEYFARGKPVRGDPALRARHDGVTYYFVSQDTLASFTHEPQRYVPQYGGFCASGAAYGLKLGSDPTEFAIRDGRLFIFGDIAGKTAWLLDPAWNIEKADLVWPESQGNGWRWQSIKRYVNKVPWYRNGKMIRAQFHEQHPGQSWPAYDAGSMMQNLFFKSPGWRARDGYSQPRVGLVGSDPCPPACAGTVSPAFGQ